MSEASHSLYTSVGPVNHRSPPESRPVAYQTLLRIPSSSTAAWEQLARVSWAVLTPLS